MVLQSILFSFALLASLFFPFSNLDANPIEAAVGFEFKPDRHFMQHIPAIPFNEEDLSLLASGKPVIRLLDIPGGFKAGYMRIFLPLDLPTTWHIITDIDHFSMVSPDYPTNGSLLEKRRTFMPFVFDSSACENGRYLYQLLVMPLITPRHFTLNRSANRAALPWESKWSQEPEMRCQNALNPQMETYRKEAITPLRNEGSWRLSPLPKEFITAKEDLLKTDCVYYVDSDPGGNLSSLMTLINKIKEMALPSLARNLIFHGMKWDDHMRKHHTPDQYEAWKAQVRSYKSAIGYTP